MSVNFRALNASLALRAGLVVTANAPLHAALLRAERLGGEAANGAFRAAIAMVPERMFVRRWDAEGVELEAHPVSPMVFH